MGNVISKTSTTRLSRRRVLGLGTTGLSLFFLSPLLSNVVAEEARHNIDLDLFMRVSKTLTMKEKLSETIGERIFRALGGDDTEFVMALKRLDAGAQSPGNWSTGDKELAGRIIKTWYLGRTGDGPDAEVIAYENALMFDPVSDVLMPRTYCYSKPGHWSTNPNQSV